MQHNESSQSSLSPPPIESTASPPPSTEQQSTTHSNTTIDATPLDNATATVEAQTPPSPQQMLGFLASDEDADSNAESSHTRVEKRLSEDNIISRDSAKSGSESLVAGDESSVAVDASPASGFEAAIQSRDLDAAAQSNASGGLGGGESQSGQGEVELRNVGDDSAQNDLSHVAAPVVVEKSVSTLAHSGGEGVKEGGRGDGRDNVPSLEALAYDAGAARTTNASDAIL